MTMLKERKITFKITKFNYENASFYLDMLLDGELAGFASAEINFDFRDVGSCESVWEIESHYGNAIPDFEKIRKDWLFHISVEPDFQGQGLARILLQGLETTIAKIQKNTPLEGEYSFESAKLLGVVSAGGQGLDQEELKKFYYRYGFDDVEEEQFSEIEGIQTQVTDFGFVIEELCQKEFSQTVMKLCETVAENFKKAIEN